MSSTRTYREYVKMFNSDDKIVYKDWFIDSGFINFLNDMGNAPSKHILIKIDNNGIYEPSNCKWENRINVNTRIKVVIDEEINLNSSGVYKLEFENNNFYIGSTKNFKVRLGIFKNKSSKSRTHNKRLDKCIDDCKWMKFIVLEEVVDFRLLKKKETEYLLLNKNNPLMLNRALNAESNLGIKWTNEEKLLVSKALLNNPKCGRPRKNSEKKIHTLKNYYYIRT